MIFLHLGFYSKIAVTAGMVAFITCKNASSNHLPLESSSLISESRSTSEYLPLSLIRESKLCRLFSASTKNDILEYYRSRHSSADQVTDVCNGKYEASGIDWQKGHVLVALDNTYSILKIPIDPNLDFSNQAIFVGAKPDLDRGQGFESVVIDDQSNFVSFGIEATKNQSGHFVGAFVPFADNIGILDVDSIEKNKRNLLIDDKRGEKSGRFASANKGYEGSDYLVGEFKSSNGHDYQYLFMLCEGNYCGEKANANKHSNPGNGRLHVYRRKKSNQNISSWSKPLIIEFGDKISFTDYSGLDIHWSKKATSQNPEENNVFEGSVLLSSQEDAAVWIGKFRFYENERSGAALAEFYHQKKHFGLTILGGNYYSFGDRANQPEYCNIEGVAWLGAPQNRMFAAVSDSYKKRKQDKKCRFKDQSIHVFKY